MLLEQAATILDQRASKLAASQEAEQQPLQVDSDEVAFLEKALARARQAAEAAQRGLDALFLETSDDHEELETATWAGAIDNEPPTPIVSRLSRHSISINLPPSSPDNHHGSVRLKRLMLNAVRATRAFESSLSLGSLSITSSAIDAEEELLGRPITLENALDIFNIQGKKVVGLIDCIIATPRPWDTPAALKTIAKAAAELLPPMGGELDKDTRERREAEHSANVGKHLSCAEALLASSDPELVLNLLRRVVELSPGWNFDASGRIDSAPSLGAAQHGHKTDRATPTPTAPPPLPTAPPPPPLAAATAATAWAPAKDGSNPLLPRAQTAPATLSAGATGIVQVAAKLTASGVPRAQGPPDQPSVSQREAHAIRHLAFCHLPYSHITFEDVSRMRKALFCRAPEIDPPHAIVTVGPPGCGKSFLMNTRQGQADFAGLPPLDCFATIDPDETVHFICGGKGQPVDPASRPLANFINHENFLISVAQRRPLLFDGSGRDPLNICGRVISRMAPNGYRVTMVIVLCSYARCLERARIRQAQTGRETPVSFIDFVFKSLQSAVPLYIRQHAHIAERLLVYSNEVEPQLRFMLTAQSVAEAPHLVEDAVEHALEYLAMPSQEGSRESLRA